MRIELGDIGIVLGWQGTFCVTAGAAPPYGIVPVSASARQSAEESDVLTVHQPRGGLEQVKRSDFIPLHFATVEQRAAAGLRGN